MSWIVDKAIRGFAEKAAGLEPAERTKLVESLDALGSLVHNEQPADAIAHQLKKILDSLS